MSIQYISLLIFFSCLFESSSRKMDQNCYYSCIFDMDNICKDTCINDCTLEQKGRECQYNEDKDWCYGQTYLSCYGPRFESFETFYERFNDEERKSFSKQSYTRNVLKYYQKSEIFITELSNAFPEYYKLSQLSNIRNDFTLQKRYDFIMGSLRPCLGGGLCSAKSIYDGAIQRYKYLYDILCKSYAVKICNCDNPICSEGSERIKSCSTDCFNKCTGKCRKRF